jgi:hypothetical protein
VKQETITRIKLIASEGNTLTNGEHLGKEVYLGVNDDPADWYEITDDEADKIQAEREAEALLAE